MMLLMDMKVITITNQAAGPCSRSRAARCEVAGLDMVLSKLLVPKRRRHTPDSYQTDTLEIGRWFWTVNWTCCPGPT